MRRRSLRVPNNLNPLVQDAFEAHTLNQGEKSYRICSKSSGVPTFFSDPLQMGCRAKIKRAGGDDRPLIPVYPVGPPFYSAVGPLLSRDGGAVKCPFDSSVF